MTKPAAAREQRPRSYPGTTKGLDAIVGKFNLSPIYYKGSLDQNHFIFEIDVGKKWIRHRTTFQSRFQKANGLSVNQP